MEETASRTRLDGAKLAAGGGGESGGGGGNGGHSDGRVGTGGSNVFVADGTPGGVEGLHRLGCEGDGQGKGGVGCGGGACVGVDVFIRGNSAYLLGNPD